MIEAQERRYRISILPHNEAHHDLLKASKAQCALGWRPVEGDWCIWTLTGVVWHFGVVDSVHDVNERSVILGKLVTEVRVMCRVTNLDRSARMTPRLNFQVGEQILPCPPGWPEEP